MAEVFGFLRDDATAGERITCNLLEKNLPKEFSLYVETPIRNLRNLRYPDFVILTNYGVIVLEVKDWVTVTKADPQGATIRTRSGETRFEHNPVGKARKFAIALSQELNYHRYSDGVGEAIPWSYAAVLINLPMSVITQLRRPWGDEFVLGKTDLENPDILLDRLKKTFPVERMRALTRSELDSVRATIYPVVEIQLEGRPPFVLDTIQEKLVAEPVVQDKSKEVQRVKKEEEARRQSDLFTEIQSVPLEEGLPEQLHGFSTNTSIRLVRGFSGSGKTLVLIQRAKFLAAQFPEWSIGVLTYNKPLQKQLETAFSGTGIEARTFHKICWDMVNCNDQSEVDLADWLHDHRFDYPEINKLGETHLKEEIDWLRDVGITTIEAYLEIERHGIAKDLRLTTDQRRKVFDIYQAYRTYLREQSLWDWEEIPLMALENLKQNPSLSKKYDVILVDEAQDWAPIWFQIVTRLLNPDHGTLFLADDPAQSIFRYFSWKEKGVAVVGRTRWLKVPYRNTYQIYKAAYGLIDGYKDIQSSLAEEGELITPELSDAEMRSGPRPLIRRCGGIKEEYSMVKNMVDTLKQSGIRADQIAVLVRFNSDKEPFENALRGTEVIVHPIHSFKGLEMDAIIIPHLQKTFNNPEPLRETSERRLLYMAMSRARSTLYMTYSGRLPAVYDSLRSQSLVDLMG